MKFSEEEILLSGYRVARDSEKIAELRLLHRPFSVHQRPFDCYCSR